MILLPKVFSRVLHGRLCAFKETDSLDEPCGLSESADISRKLAVHVEIQRNVLASQIYVSNCV